jgi:hypothetical protein
MATTVDQATAALRPLGGCVDKQTPSYHAPADLCIAKVIPGYGRIELTLRTTDDGRVRGAQGRGWPARTPEQARMLAELLPPEASFEPLTAYKLWPTTERLVELFEFMEDDVWSALPPSPSERRATPEKRARRKAERRASRRNRR